MTDHPEPDKSYVATLFDGQKIPVFTPEQVDVLEAIITDRLWWEEFLRRSKLAGTVIGLGLAVLMGLAAWWPWITRIIQSIIVDVPK